MTSSTVVDALTVARRHTHALTAIAVTSIVAAAMLWHASHGPSGRDPLYVALAMQFAIWGAIDLAFALNGLVGLGRISHADRGAVEAMRARTLRLLGVNSWLNLIWLAVGAALLGAGFYLWSPALAGHGLGVLLQALPLTILDASFASGLRRAALASPFPATSS